MEPVLTITNLTKRFNGLTAVDGISFEVMRGEIFGFLGPNGAGKTTSIKMLCGLLQPDGGEIRFHADRPDKRIGFCPQGIVIWENLTCIEQLSFMGEMHGLPRAKAKAGGLDLLAALGLTEKKDSLGKTLSGGMQRRLNIALALVHEPEILFLDEPQAGLDPQSRVLVREYIRSIKSATTVVITTHDMEEAEKLSDRVCIIDRGKILTAGTVDEIKKSLGQGDMLELSIRGDIRRDLLPYIQGSFTDAFDAGENTIALLAENANETIGEITGILEQRGIGLENMKLRKKSLEDVFIHLTGRGLRE